MHNVRNIVLHLCRLFFGITVNCVRNPCSHRVSSEFGINGVGGRSAF